MEHIVAQFWGEGGGLPCAWSVDLIFADHVKISMQTYHASEIHSLIVGHLSYFQF